MAGKACTFKAMRRQLNTEQCKGWSRRGNFLLKAICYSVGHRPQTSNKKGFFSAKSR